MLGMTLLHDAAMVLLVLAILAFIRFQWPDSSIAHTLNLLV